MIRPGDHVRLRDGTSGHVRAVVRPDAPGCGKVQVDMGHYCKWLPLASVRKVEAAK